MKKTTLSFLAAVIALSPLPAFAQGPQPSIQKNTNGAAAVVTGNSIYQNTDKFGSCGDRVSATTEAQASDPRLGALAPAVRDVATDGATALGRDRHAHKKVFCIAGYRGNSIGRGR
jgi:hypothetical protein